MLVAPPAAVGTLADRAATAGRSPESETLITVDPQCARVQLIMRLIGRPESPEGADYAQAPASRSIHEGCEDR